MGFKTKLLAILLGVVVGVSLWNCHICTVVTHAGMMFTLAHVTTLFIYEGHTALGMFDLVGFPGQESLLHHGGI
jgi:hypothetical protein